MIGLLAVLAVCSCGKKKEDVVQPVKVKTEIVGKGEVNGGQSYTGTIEEMNGVALSFTVGGTLKQLLVDEGQMVAKGQLIAVTDGQDARNNLEMSKANVQSAKAAYDQALDAYKRMKMIHDKGSLSDIKWVEAQSNLERAKAALEGAQAQIRIASKTVGDTRLNAPFSGYISKKNVEIGQTVTPGLAIVNLVRIDNVKVKISVPETEISSIPNGSTVRVRVDALGNRFFTGHITEKNVSGNALSHTYDVKAVIANADHKLLPGMIAEVETSRKDTDDPTPAGRGSAIPGGAAANPVSQNHPNGDAAPIPVGEGQGVGSASISLPAGIIQLDADNHTFVWTVVGGKAQKTFVTTGENIGDKVAIVSGLQPGDKVITEGQQKVSTGMAVSE